MRKLALLGFLFLGAFASAQNQKKAARKVPAEANPECAQGSICFSGEIGEGREFRKDLNSGLDFVLGLPGNFGIVLQNAATNCNDLFCVANPPFMAHHDTEIDAAYQV
jgi:hypothetical protein